LIIKEKAMPIGPSGERLPYPGEPGAGPMNPGMGVGPQMPPIEAVVARIQELQAELQQLVALAEQMSGPQQGSNPDRGMAMEYEASKGGGGLLA